MGFQVFGKSLKKTKKANRHVLRLVVVKLDGPWPHARVKFSNCRSTITLNILLPIIFKCSLKLKLPSIASCVF